MATRIIPKKSTVAAKVPLDTDLEIGEIAINLTDQKLYSKNASNQVVQIAGVKYDQDLNTTDDVTFNSIDTGNILVSGTVDGRDIAADGIKLDGIEAGADVTDTANVTAAGALMDSEVTNLAAVKAFDPTDYATAAQGSLADSALQSSDIGVSVQAYNNNTVIDGSYVHTDNNYTTTEKNKLAGIEAGATADQTPSEILTAIKTVDGAASGLDADLLDGQQGSYYTGYTDTAAAAKVSKTGDTMTGNLSFGDNDKAIFGAGSDLQIYHSGSGSFISEVGTGNLFIQGESAVAIQNNSSQSMAIFNSGADVQLRYATTTRLATTATGVDVTGTVTANTVELGDWTITETASGELMFATGGVNKMKLDASGNLSVVGDINTNATL